ncbi:MAG TPA: hypothetical protein VGL16_14490 [Actinomycetota bacterium]
MLATDGLDLAAESGLLLGEELRAQLVGVEELEELPPSLGQATWSPDGSRIAFVGGGLDDDSEIFVMNADGTGLTQLTDNDATDDLVEWRPSTDELSFRSNRDGPLTLYIMNADGSDQGRLLDFPSADRHEWSPDGSRLAFVGSDGKDDGDGCHEDHELYVMNANGSGLLRLTDDEYYEQDPTWSPDGSQIAFSASNQSDYAWDVFVVNADGTNLRRVTDYPGFERSGDRAVADRGAGRHAVCDERRRFGRPAPTGPGGRRVGRSDESLDHRLAERLGRFPRKRCPGSGLQRSRRLSASKPLRLRLAIARAHDVSASGRLWRSCLRRHGNQLANQVPRRGRLYAYKGTRGARIVSARKGELMRSLRGAQVRGHWRAQVTKGVWVGTGAWSRRGGSIRRRLGSP